MITERKMAAKGTGVEIDIEKPIHELFREQVNLTPENTAVEFENEVLTYKSLNDKSECLAELIKSRIPNSKSIIGIIMNRSIEMLVGIIAILKSGNAYLPIDPEYPRHRINYILKDSNVKAILSQRFLADKIENEYEILFPDETDEADAGYKAVNQDSFNTAASSDLAYVIYTSGSTGQPKGVMIEHRSVANFIKGVTDIIDFSEGKRILALTTISFDIFVLETLLALTRGLTVVLAGENEQNNPRLLSALIMKSNIDMLQMTPSRMQLLLNSDKDLKCLKNISEIMIGGEAFPSALLNKIKKCSDARIYNMYGPTETTVWSTVSDLTDKDGIDVGRPIINTQVYILDENNNPVPEGREGELCIGGLGLARGYLGRPDLTEERFIPNPFVCGEKLYKTGDMGKLLQDGNIMCLGRRDNQIKIRGYRVELEEIEAQLLGCEAVKQAVVTLVDGKDNLKHLCAYIISDEELKVPDLRRQLLITLPDYFVPGYFIRVDTIPQTANGKVDRKALPKFENFNDLDKVRRIVKITDRTDAAGIFSKVKAMIIDSIDINIDEEKIEPNYNLADLGIDSIIFVKIIIAAENQFDIEFGENDLDIRKFPTVRSLTAYIENAVDRKMNGEGVSMYGENFAYSL